MEAVECVKAGADAIGIHLYERSLRYCEPQGARRIMKAVAGHALVVGVFADEDYVFMRGCEYVVGHSCVQLCGSEPPELLNRFLPHAYKTLSVRGAETIDEARRYGGKWIMLEACLSDAPGGIGARADWVTAKQIAVERPVILAGRLDPDNVADAIAAVNPFGVDANSGVESALGRKDLGKVRAFIQAAQGVGARKFG
jgi:phosphoribosylanthranilate isomerase